MRMPTRLKSMRLDDEILTAFERWCDENRKKLTAVVQEFMLETLKQAKAWPPKKGK